MVLGLLLFRKQKVSFAVFSIAFLYLFLATQPNIAKLLIFPLEHGSLSGKIASSTNIEQARFVSVLACNYHDDPNIPEISRWPRCSLQRLYTAASLIKTNPHLTLIVSAGNFGGWEYSYAEKAKEFLLEHGVPDKKIIVISEGYDTDSETQAIAKSLNSDTVLVVTSASHQKRAQSYFNKHGITAWGIPTDYLTNSRIDSSLSAPDIYSMLVIKRAMHEYLGLLEASHLVD